MPQASTCNSSLIILSVIVQGADSSKVHILPAGVPCIVSASLSSMAPNDIVLQAVRLEQSSADTGTHTCTFLKDYELLFQAAADVMYVSQQEHGIPPSRIHNKFYKTVSEVPQVQHAFTLVCLRQVGHSAQEASQLACDSGRTKSTWRLCRSGASAVQLSERQPAAAL